jgi:hypothetical protein
MIPEVCHEIDVSREKILGAIGNAPDITFLRLWGNTGDELIYAGTRQLLAKIPYVERSVHELPQIGGHAALLAGGGGWCKSYHEVPGILALAEHRFPQVVVLPSSFDTSVDVVRRSLAQSSALFFAREETSFEQIRNLCHAELAHDTAFFFNFAPYQQPGRGTLTAFRTDPEARTRRVPPGNNDISATCESLDLWLWTIARHEQVLTDRAHVMIAAAMLGKQVHYGVSNYHKVQAIVDFALKRLPVERLGETGLTVEEVQRATAQDAASSNRDDQWHDAMQLTASEIAELVPDGVPFVFVDQDELGQLPFGQRRVIPFLERQGAYWGPPIDDATGIIEVERLREAGAGWLVFAWPAFWWLDHYAALRGYLNSSFHCPLRNDRLVVFDLRSRQSVRA